MKKGISPLVAALLVLIALGLIFGAMYYLSEAPVSDRPPGPNFGGSGGASGSGGRSAPTKPAAGQGGQ